MSGGSSSIRAATFARINRSCGSRTEPTPSFAYARGLCVMTVLMLTLTGGELRLIP